MRAWLWTYAVLVLVWAGFYLQPAGFGTELFFDDAASIIANETVQGTWGEAWWPKKDNPTASRPLSNATLWINHQWTQLEPWSYLLLNRVLHLLTAGLIMQIVALCLLRRGGVLSGGWARPIASGVVALLWMLHPLTTDITAYATQRTEVLGALFLMLAWWLAIRAWWSPEPVRWVALSVLVAVVGVLGKEIAALSFAMVLMWDLAFGPGRWRGILRRRWPVYVALLVGPALTLWLILRTDPYPKSIGFHHGIGAWEYLLTQGQVILLYLRLSVWPAGLSMWHEVPWRHTLSSAWREVLPVGVLVLVSFALWVPRRTRWLGFALLCVFMLLGPTSSVIPIITEPAAERRMYLPLAALLVIAVLPMLAWLARRRALEAGVVLAAAWSVAYAGVTWQRMSELRTAEDAWLSALHLYPQSGFAASGVGQSFFEDTPPNIEVSYRYYQDAYRLQPNDWRIASSLGRMLNQLRRWDEAIPILNHSANMAGERNPDGLANLGDAYLAIKDKDNAVNAFAARVNIDPENATYLNDLGVALAHFEDYGFAISSYEKARQLDPTLGIAALNLGDALLKVDRPDLAEPQLYDAVVLIDDEDVLWGALAKHALSLARTDRLFEAITQYQRAVELFDKDPEVWNNFGVTLGRAGRFDEALAAFDKAIALDAAYEEPRENQQMVQQLMQSQATTTQK